MADVAASLTEHPGIDPIPQPCMATWRDMLTDTMGYFAMNDIFVNGDSYGRTHPHNTSVYFPPGGGCMFFLYDLDFTILRYGIPYGPRMRDALVIPIFLRKATRTRGHVFVAMLALKVVREFRRCLIAKCGTTHEDPHTVTLEDALTALARLCLSHSRVNDLTITRVPRPDALQARILSALGLQLPRTPIRRKA